MPPQDPPGDLRKASRGDQRGVVAATGATQSNTSPGILPLLASAGIITRQKDGQFVYYGDNP